MSINISIHKWKCVYNYTTYNLPLLRRKHKHKKTYHNKYTHTCENIRLYFYVLHTRIKTHGYKYTHTYENICPLICQNTCYKYMTYNLPLLRSGSVLMPWCVYICVRVCVRLYMCMNVCQQRICLAAQHHSDMYKSKTKIDCKGVCVPLWEGFYVLMHIYVCMYI